MKRHPLERIVSRQWWVISIGGYGEFGYYGTDKEAEEMRAHKAQWERGVGKKRTADQLDPIVQKQMDWVRHEIKHGYPRNSDRERAETNAVLTANTRIEPDRSS